MLLAFAEKNNLDLKIRHIMYCNDRTPQCGLAFDEVIDLIKSETMTVFIYTAFLLPKEKSFDFKALLTFESWMPVIEPGLGAGDGGLEVFGETAVATEPGKGALHHPTPGQDVDARHAVASLDDLQRPLPIFSRLAEFRSGVAPSAKTFAPQGKAHRIEAAAAAQPSRSWIWAA